MQKLQEGANELVQAHVRKHHWRGVEGWISQGLGGQEVTGLDECSFCGQSTKGLALVTAYQTYFNTAYNDHMAAIEGLRALAAAALPEPSIEAWVASVGSGRDRAGAWKPQLDLKADDPDFQRVRLLAATIRETFLHAAEKKAAAPMEALDVPVLERARTAAAELDALLRRYNDQVAAANTSIEAFKKGLANEDVPELQRQVAALKLQKVRHSDAIVALVAERAQADENRKTAEVAKEKARQELNQLMKDLLTRYQASINKWLGIFGAPFSIDNMGVTYQGSTTPRTEYAIVLRKTRVQAGKKTVNGACPEFCV